MSNELNGGLDDQVFEALLALGYKIDIGDDGVITATKGEETLKGKVKKEGGVIDWQATPAQLAQILWHNRIRELRERVEARRAAEFRRQMTPPSIR